MKTAPLPRLYPILDSGVLAARGCALETAARALIEAGAGILQIRHKARWRRSSFAEAERIAALCRNRGVPLVINDRADIAALLTAGVHVGQDDLAPRDARRLVGADAMLGYSTHNAAQLAAGDNEPVSYLAIGPIFATASKDNPDPVLGLSGLARVRPLTNHPLVAIGGITRKNARSVLAAGADSVAVIGDLLPEVVTMESLRNRFDEWIQLIGAGAGRA
jgi:thiamine-phosphate pyrophosphorylase